jgi:hypothetical protein
VGSAEVVNPEGRSTAFSLRKTRFRPSYVIWLLIKERYFSCIFGKKNFSYMTR